MHGRLRGPVCLAALLWWCSLASGQDSAWLQERILVAVSAYEKASKAVVGLSVVELAGGRVLAAARDDEGRVPASNQKVLTSAFALARLGGQFEFRTGVFLRGRDVIVVGDFDPTLGDPVLAEAEGKSIYLELDRWALAIRQNLTGREVGDILLVCGVDARQYRSADWPAAQHGSWYAAPVAALNFNNNCLDVTFAADKGALVPRVSPSSRLIRLVNKITAGSRQVWSLRCNADDSVVTLTGTVNSATDEPISAAINDPPLLLGRALADRIERAGLAFSGSVRKVPQEKAALEGARLLCVTSTPLASALSRANKRSLNMTAECIFLRAGDGTWEGSARLMSQVLAENYGLKEGSFLVRDGGGLSQKNRVSPSAMTSLLRRMLERRDAKVFLDSLPASGVDGTMRTRLADKAYTGRVLGKTGYIAGAWCLSGYVLDGSGRPAIAFSILANRADAQAKALQDRICRLLVDWLGYQASSSPTISSTRSLMVTMPTWRS